MNKKPIIIISDFEFDSTGYPTTGYTNIAVTLGNALTKTGKYKVYGYGFSYRRGETQTLFGVNAIQVPDLPQLVYTLHNGMGIVDVLYIFDIPFIEHIFATFKPYPPMPKVKSHGIFAVESDPLCTSWAMSMSFLNSRAIISQFGTDEAQKTGLDAVYYPVPVNLDVWKFRSAEQQKLVKDAFGLCDKYVIFVNADGNERKNLSAMMEGLSAAIKVNPNIHMVLLTRKNFAMSWRLDDLMLQLGIENNLTIVDRGIPQEDVWKLYVMADVLYNCSKAEGLGIPILEAMAVGVPVVATNATAMRESLSDGRGILLDADYIWIDPFGNTNRYFVFPNKIAAQMLEMASKPNGYYNKMVEDARLWVEKRDVGTAVAVVEGMLDNEQK